MNRINGFKLILILFLFQVNTVRSQSFKCGNLDTIIFLGNVGGYDLVFEKDYFLAQDSITLNQKDLTIISYVVCPTSEHIRIFVNSNKLPLKIKNRILQEENLGVYIENIKFEDKKGNLGCINRTFRIHLVNFKSP